MKKKFVTNDWHLIAYFIAIMLSVACFNTVHANGTDMKNQDQESFYIDIGKTAETDLLRKVRSLETGTSVEVAKSIVGQPTEDKMLIGKKGEFHARLLRYYIRKLDTGVNEIHDRYVSIYFDEADKLKSVGYKLSEELDSQTNDKTK